MNNAVYSKTNEDLRNSFDVRLVSNKKSYLKWTSKSGDMSKKIFDNDLAPIHKSIVTLRLKKPAYVEMSTLDLSEVLFYEFHYYYIKNNYGKNSRLL